jgi:ectoine hydroxylase-related dioxygenase (phytanoyl-CoA dioxygenase family)
MYLPGNFYENNHEYFNTFKNNFMQEVKFKDGCELASLNDYQEISVESIRDFRENGHVLIPGILSAIEINAYKLVIENAADKFNTEKRKLQDRDTYGKAFLQIMNLWQHDEDVKKFVLARRFAKIAANLLGVENVRIYHDQALFKEPGGGPTPWHQDQYYWPIDTHKTITMWMPLVDIDVNMGMLTFASGSQKKGVIFDYEISDLSDAEFEKYIEKNSFPIIRSSSMKAGDATWHYGNTIHSAPANNSQIMRKIVTIIYVADGARVTQPTNKWQTADLKKWLMNTPVGELVDSEMNPLVL